MRRLFDVLTNAGPNLNDRLMHLGLDSLLKQEFAKAFEQETGKRLATHQDIENVLHEVRAVTRETELVKAKIGRDLWTRQMVWQQKREAYAKVLTVSHAVREALIEAMGAALNAITAQDVRGFFAYRGYQILGQLL